MSNRRRHFAHRHQSARELQLLFLLVREFLRLLAGRDVGRDLHLREVAVDPLDVLAAHLEPLLDALDVDLLRVRGAARQRGGGQAGERVDHVDRVGRRLRAVEAAARQLEVAVRANAEQVAVVAVREQQLGFVGGEHRHRGVEALEHRGEALVRGGEFLARALRLGDVGHRRHPAGLAAGAVDQRRHVQARMEQRAVLAPHAQLEARTRRLAAQRHVELALHLGVGIARPVRERRDLADEVALVPAGHPAERRVHVRDAAVHVEHAHADQHRILHRAAEECLRVQRLLRLEALARVLPKAPEAPQHEARQPRDEPDERIVGEVGELRERVDAHGQALAGRVERQVVVRVARQARARRRRRQLAIVRVSDRDLVLRRQLLRDVVLQDPLDRKHGRERAEVFAVAAHHGRLQRDVAVAEVVVDERGVRLAARVARLVVCAAHRVLHLRVAGPREPLAEQRRMHGRPALRAGRRVPVEIENLGMRLHHVRDRHLEAVLVETAGREVARQCLELFLRARHRQADLLLRPRDVAEQRVFLLLLLAAVEAPQDQAHHHEEDEDRQERRQQIGIGPPRSVVPTGRLRFRRRARRSRRACEKPVGQHARIVAQHY